jgi:hypothetical protein
MMTNSWKLEKVNGKGESIDAVGLRANNKLMGKIEVCC